MSKSLQKFYQELSSIGCVLCRRDNGDRVTAELHHVAEGSGQRSDWLVVPLCPEHHRIGPVSLHGAGVKQFLRIHRLPTEFHLLELVNEYRAKDGV